MNKEFKFETFEEASNFILRYTEYCTKISASPSWYKILLIHYCYRFNVYNTVKVSLKNDEFGQISTKEV